MQGLLIGQREIPDLLLDRNERRFLTCNGLFHPCSNVAMLYLKRCAGRRGVISAKDWVLSKCNGSWDYLEKSEEPMLKAVVKEEFMVEKREGKSMLEGIKKRNKTNWKEKSLHGKFPKSVVHFADSVS